MRGLFTNDTKCPLVLDDMAIMGNQHYPCIIYMREGGSAIGTVEVCAERKAWFENVNVYENKIFRKNCLDVCVEISLSSG